MVPFRMMGIIHSKLCLSESSNSEVSISSSVTAKFAALMILIRLFQQPEQYTCLVNDILRIKEAKSREVFPGMYP